MNLSINNAFVASKGQFDDTSKQFLFRLALAKQLIDGFSARKRQLRKREANQDDSTLAKKKKIKTPLGVTVVKEGSTLKHEGVTFSSRKRVCAWCQKTSARTPSGRVRETVHGCSTCDVHLHKGACFQKYHDVEVFLSGQPQQ